MSATALLRIPSTHTSLEYRGRWNAHGSPLASWSGSSLSFLFTGPVLFLQLAAERRDKWNGLIRSLVWTIDGKVFSSDVADNERIQLFGENENAVSADTITAVPRHVQVILADWASEIRLEAFFVDKVRKRFYPQKPPLRQPIK